MKITIDSKQQQLEINDNGENLIYNLYSQEAFEILSHQWLKVGWNQKYTYTFSWMGRPVIQLPEDMIRIQEVIYTIKPDVILETGIAHGGSLIYFASLCRAMNHGRVIGVDIEIRSHNRKAIEEHHLFELITLVEGDAVDSKIVESVKNLIKPGEKVLVILDSNHTREHVHKELKCYGDLVSSGSYIIATDGFMQYLEDVPRGEAGWEKDNPAQAAMDFIKTNPEFELVQPAWEFNESELEQNVTHWPGAYLRRK